VKNKKIYNKISILLVMAVMVMTMSLKVNAAGVAIKNFEVEPNDDVSTPNEIALGNAYSGKADKDSDIDRFIFAAPDNGNDMCKLLLFKQSDNNHTKYGYWIRDISADKYIKQFSFINNIERHEFETIPGHVYELLILGETQGDYYQFMIYQ
jgi:hypothetical protein